MPDNEKMHEDRTVYISTVPGAKTAVPAVTVSIKNRIPLAILIIVVGITLATLLGYIQHEPAEVITMFLTVVLIIIEIIRPYYKL